jgi:tripartite-type tricarboxylate transporter receptor subunit TctC
MKKHLTELMGAVALAVALAAPGAAVAQEYPDRPIQMLVAFAAGGGTDTMARIVADELGKVLGTSVVVENRAGADGSIAAAVLADSDPDGYTIAVVSNSHTITPSTTNIPYDPIADFAPVTMLATQPSVLLAHPSVEVGTLEEMIEVVKANPDAFSYGHSGQNTSPYMAMQRLLQTIGVEMVGVPYDGANPAVLGLLSGEVQFMFGSASTTIPHITAGKLKGLIVSSDERLANAPDIPTAAEAGMADLKATTWYGILAPAGTPPEIVQKLNEATVTALNSEAVSKRLQEGGASYQIVGNTVEEFTDVIKRDIETWKEVVANIKK